MKCTSNSTRSSNAWAFDHVLFCFLTERWGVLLSFTVFDTEIQWLYILTVASENPLNPLHLIKGTLLQLHWTYRLQKVRLSHQKYSLAIEKYGFWQCWQFFQLFDFKQVCLRVWLSVWTKGAFYCIKKWNIKLKITCNYVLKLACAVWGICNNGWFSPTLLYENLFVAQLVGSKSSSGSNGSFEWCFLFSSPLTSTGVFILLQIKL